MTKMNEELKQRLSPAWLLDCVMYDSKQNALVVSPLHCQKNGISNLKIAQHTFEGRTILQFRLDFDLRRVKIGSDGKEVLTHSKERNKP